MNRFSVPLLLVVLAGAASSFTTAHAGDLRYGDRVRVNATNDAGKLSQVTGTVVSLDGEALVIKTRATGHLRDYDASSEQTRTIPLNSITSVDRSVGREHHTTTGLVLGAASGVALGLIVWDASKQSDNASNDFSAAIDQSIEAQLAPAYIVLFGVLGAGIGGVIGHASGDER